MGDVDEDHKIDRDLNAWCRPNDLSIEPTLRNYFKYYDDNYRQLSSKLQTVEARIKRNTRDTGIFGKKLEYIGPEADLTLQAACHDALTIYYNE